MCHRSIHQNSHLLDCLRRLKGLSEVNIIVIENKDKSQIHQSPQYKICVTTSYFQTVMNEVELHCYWCEPFSQMQYLCVVVLLLLRSSEAPAPHKGNAKRLSALAG